ncbi:TIR domain-containing protein [Streptomyces sp. NPDC000594]|uniref:TIR domain-containing protein n=1 Tax=Streptomyces sp. NPDC000594 TaxID=3154261 RepID=UPI003325F47E
MEQPTVPGHVFLSYVREDTELALKVAHELRRGGVRVWLDRDGIRPGARWRSVIRGAIGEGAFFLACFSAEYAGRSRTYMNEELTLAVEELRRRPTDISWFIPVRLTPCRIPDREIGGGQTLKDLQSVDLFADWEGGLRALLDVMAPARTPHPVSGNLTLLERGTPVERRVARVVEGWVSTGRGGNWLVNGKAFFLFYCWFLARNRAGGAGGAGAPTPETVDYAAACLAAIGGERGWQLTLAERLTCPGCRDTYRAENIGICVGCVAYLCPFCAHDHRGPECEVVG